MARCPNCDNFIPWDASDCIHCNASFAPDSEYRPKLTRGWEFRLFDERARLADPRAAPLARAVSALPTQAASTAHGTGGTTLHGYEVRRISGGVSVGLPNPVLMIVVAIGGGVFGLAFMGYMLFDFLRNLGWWAAVPATLFHILVFANWIQICRGMTPAVISPRGIVARSFGPWRRFTDVGEPIRLSVEEPPRGLHAFFSGAPGKSTLQVIGPDGVVAIATGEADVLAELRDEIGSCMKNLRDT